MLAAHAYGFVPLVTESYGRLGPAAMQFLVTIAKVATERMEGDPERNRAVFVEGALRELAVCLCRGVGRMYRASLQVRARAAGARWLAGLESPALEPADD